MPPKGWKHQTRLRGHEGTIGRFRWSPDGARIATPGFEGRLAIWNVADNAVVAARDFGPPVWAAAWTPSGDAIAISTSDDSLRFMADEGIDATYSIYGLEEDIVLSAFETGDLDDELAGTGKAFIRLVDAESGMQIGTLDSSSLTHRPTDLVWIDDNRLVTASPDGIALWHARDGHFLGFLERGLGHRFVGVACSSDGALVYGAQHDGVVLTWDALTGQVVSSARSDEDSLVCIGVAPNSPRFAVGSSVGGVEVFEGAGQELELRTLEGHTAAVTSVAFSADGKLLASAGKDGALKLWDTSSWTLLGETRDQSMSDMNMSVAFDPNSSIVAVTADKGQSVRLWSLDLAAMAARQQRPRTVNYANAKVVLLGDTGVGKTGLGLVLCRQNFRPTESTHRRNVWMLSAVATEGEGAERREVYLWDLAGQPGYRLLHQLHLSDVAVALVVFDARNEIDPLSGVRYWARALTQAERQRQAEPGKLQRILVAARMDRGGARIDAQELRDTRARFGFEQYVTTSAKDGAGVGTLRAAIDKAIDWDVLPKVSSTELFDSIRSFLRHKRDSDLVLSREADLLSQFAATGAAGADDVQAEFRICIDRAQSRGLVRRLSFGDLVLLNPEVLDAYAAAVLNAAGADPDALGAISELDVREGRFAIPDEDRLADTKAEHLLLIATIEDLLHHEVALREDSGEGTYLVFPSQATRHLEPEIPLVQFCRFEFEGPIQHVWATLIVRLAHSGVFTKDDVGDHAALFRAGGRSIGVRLKLLDEGRGRVELLREDVESSESEHLLEEFVAAHLRKRAVASTVTRQAVIACECGFVVPDELLAAVGAAEAINCPMCPRSIVLPGSEATFDEGPEPADVRLLQHAADRERTRLTSRATASGKDALHEFDVFLAHNSKDKDAAAALAERLRDVSINPWFDKDEIAPGQWFQDVIQAAVTKVNSAAVIIGTHGLGRWEELELRTFVSRCVELEIPVIPVLLPEAVMPPTAPFLQELQYVQFQRSIEEAEPFSRLVWGITGNKELLAKTMRKR